MRILHTSDWHLGRILHGVHLTEDQRERLESLIEAVDAEKPDVIVIAGDIFDRAVPPVEAVELLDDFLNRIVLERGIPVIAIAGNHDSGERIHFGSALLSRGGLHLFGTPQPDVEPVVLRDAAGEIHFYALPYMEPAIVAQWTDSPIRTHEEAMAYMIERIRWRMDPSARNVLVAHVFAVGGQVCESEHPLSVGGADQVSTSLFELFDYAALGHLHAPQMFGDGKIRYSGSLMKYSFSEANQNKGVLLVDLERGGLQVRNVAIRSSRDLRVLEGMLEDLVVAGRSGETGREDYLKVVLRDRGALFDPIGKLRQVYPNVMRLERADLSSGTANTAGRAPKDFNRMGEKELFRAFYEQVGKKTWDEALEQAAAELLDEFNAGTTRQGEGGD